jgi:hypothetical protein
MLRRRWPVAVLVLWSLYVWSQRIVNALGDDEANKPVAVALAASVLVPAVLSGVVLVQSRSRRLSLTEIGLWRALAGWTALVWIVRGGEIALSDHELPFKVVHVALGVVSVVLAGLTWRVARREEAAGPVRGGPSGRGSGEAGPSGPAVSPLSQADR